MGALPKRKPSRQRQGKRRRANHLSSPKPNICPQCGGEKLSHFICPHCQGWESRKKSNEKKPRRSKTLKKNKSR